MYAGDKARDAASKIRGFLYQDYVTIICLLQEHVECVCSEYLEDVDVFYDNGKFECIQVKYYPSSNLKMEEISTDLYYQYLRLLMLGSKLKVIPKLYVHRNGTTRKLTKERLENYVKKIVSLPNNVVLMKPDDFALWLKENINNTTDKDKQKETLFAEWASVSTIKSFVDEMEIVSIPDICNYRQKLMKKLSTTYPNLDRDGDDEKWQLILLGLAITNIQRRYNSEQKDFNSIRVDKIEFDKYMRSATQTVNENTIAAYFLGIVSEVYESIIIHNTTLSDLKKNMIANIYQNTLYWIEKLAITKEGQYQMLYVCSYEEAEKLSNFKTKNATQRLGLIKEAKTAFVDFLKYLWKIMLNICVKNVTSISQISEYPKLFNPVTYIDASQTEYICLNFPEDHANHSVILPSARSTFKGTKRKLIDRFINLEIIPEKWFFDNADNIQGENYYNYRVTNVRKRATIAEIEKDGFWIECMQCIGIDEEEWDKFEDCSECIFKDTCVKG